MIKIVKTDTIIDILNKMNNNESDEIKLDFPFGHPILHNHLSLKILKTKAKNKKLYIVSNDKTAKKISKILGIKFITNKKIEEKTIRNTQDILKANYSFGEYTIFELKNIIGKFKNIFKTNIKNNKKINNIFYLTKKYQNTNKNIIIYFLLLLTLISILLLYIYYIAINKTYITIYPENIIQVKSKNFTFIEEGSEDKYNYINNKILISKIKKKIILSKTIGTSGIKQKDEKLSKGKVKLYNYLNEEVFLFKNTTLENKEGVQFFLPKNISIESATIKNGKVIPGEKVIEIKGKVKLLNGDYSGLKTNIEIGTLLIIPKLGDKKTKIFAKSISKFSGSSNNFTKYLTEKDLNNAKKLLKDTLKETAIKKLKEEIKQNNNKNSIKVDILPIDNIYKFNNLQINIPEHLKIGDEINNFKVSGEIEITSYTYNKQAIISLLKNSIKETLIKNSYVLIGIDEKQLRFSHILKRNDLKKNKGKYYYIQKLDKSFILKATLQIDYITNRKFNKENAIFIQKLKHSILGKKIKEAEKILINNEVINNVKIKVQPFFIKNISKIPENIEIKIKNN